MYITRCIAQWIWHYLATVCFFVYLRFLSYHFSINNISRSILLYKCQFLYMDTSCMIVLFVSNTLSF